MRVGLKELHDNGGDGEDLRGNKVAFKGCYRPLLEEKAHPLEELDEDF